MRSSITIVNAKTGISHTGGKFKEANNTLLDVRENINEDDSDEELVSLDGSQKEMPKTFKLGVEGRTFDSKQNKKQGKREDGE